MLKDMISGEGSFAGKGGRKEDDQQQGLDSNYNDSGCIIGRLGQRQIGIEKPICESTMI